MVVILWHWIKIGCGRLWHWQVRCVLGVNHALNIACENWLICESNFANYIQMYSNPLKYQLTNRQDKCCGRIIQN